MIHSLHFASFRVILLSLFFCLLAQHSPGQAPAFPRPSLAASGFEYLWYEAENMRGITETARHEPLLNPSYLDLPSSKAPVRLNWAR